MAGDVGEPVAGRAFGRSDAGAASVTVARAVGVAVVLAFVVEVVATAPGADLPADDRPAARPLTARTGAVTGRAATDRVARAALDARVGARRTAAATDLGARPTRERRETVERFATRSLVPVSRFRGRSGLAARFDGGDVVTLADVADVADLADLADLPVVPVRDGVAPSAGRGGVAERGAVTPGRTASLGPMGG